MHDQLGPDPAKLLMQGTGEWALRGLAVVLLATPMAKWGWPGLFPYRRMLGLVRLFVRQPSSFTLCAGLCGLECDAPVRGIARQALCAGGFYRLARAIAVGADLNASRPQSVRAQLAPATSLNLPRCGAGMAAFILVSAF